MASKTGQMPPRRGRGFERASGLLATRVRKAGERRGFAVSKVLTHWAEVVGEDVSAIAQPIRVSYGREGFGATLTLLTTGAAAPMLQMRLPEIRDRINACYGYAAISHVKITQTAPAGFFEGQAEFRHASKAPARDDPPPAVMEKASAASAGVTDPGLRAALERLALNVLSRN